MQEKDCSEEKGLDVHTRNSHERNKRKKRQKSKPCTTLLGTVQSAPESNGLARDLKIPRKKKAETKGRKRDKKRGITQRSPTRVNTGGGGNKATKTTRGRQPQEGSSELTWRLACCAMCS